MHRNIELIIKRRFEWVTFYINFKFIWILCNL